MKHCKPVDVAQLIAEHEAKRGESAAQRSTVSSEPTPEVSEWWQAYAQLVLDEMEEDRMRVGLALARAGAELDRVYGGPRA